MIFVSNYLIICRGWIKYTIPSIFILLAITMLWHRYTNKKKPLEAFKIRAPPTKNPVEQLITLQEAIAQVEGSIQSVNIILLKVRALIFAVVPQVPSLDSFRLVWYIWPIYICITRLFGVLQSNYLLAIRSLFWSICHRRRSQVEALLPVKKMFCFNINSLSFGSKNADRLRLLRISSNSVRTRGFLKIDMYSNVQWHFGTESVFPCTSLTDVLFVMESSLDYWQVMIVNILSQLVEFIVVSFYLY